VRPPRRGARPSTSARTSHPRRSSRGSTPPDDAERARPAGPARLLPRAAVGLDANTRRSLPLTSRRIRLPGE
jgi:hypothetical protein